ncbi:MAG: ribonuclease P protein component [Granulosicoccaceae bacterium]
MAAESLAFPRTVRLLTPADFGQVFKRNKRASNHHWIVLAHRGLSPVARIGMAIAKKKAKRAVDRNRIKRVLRESFREQQRALAGLDVVVLNKPSAAAANSRELRASIDAIWAELAALSR